MADPVQKSVVSTGDGELNDAGAFGGMQGPNGGDGACRARIGGFDEQCGFVGLLKAAFPFIKRGDGRQAIDAGSQMSGNQVPGDGFGIRVSREGGV